MAVPLGSSSSCWTCITPSPRSVSRNNFKLTSWPYVGQRYEIRHLNNIKGRMIHGVPKSKAGSLTKRLITFAASEGKSPHSEPSLDALELERSHLLAEDDSSSCNAIFLADRTEGKPGFISFHGLPYQSRAEILGSSLSKETPNYIWFIGPTVLVAFLVFPSLYLRRILSTVFEDSLLTDFLILFFTEALFYGGVAIFLLLVDHVWRPLQHLAPKNNDRSKTLFGLRISSVATLVLSLIIPLVTMGMVWPWTGPAASATLAPYLVGLVVQFAFEQYARHQKSPAWLVIPVVFQVYRLHQLNRAAQLVTALSFSVRGAETTSQTLAIHSSLGTLLAVLQILGVICIWSLASYLMRFLPSVKGIPES